MKIQAPDTVLQKQTAIIVMSSSRNPITVAPKFDKKGNYEFKDTFSLPDKRFFLATGRGLQKLFLKDKSQTTIKVTKLENSQYPKYIYNGYASDAYELADAMRDGFAYARYFSRKGDNKETLANYDKKLADLDSLYTSYLTRAKSLKEKELVEIFTDKSECEYLMLKGSLMKLYDKENGIDFLEDAKLQSVIDRIDVNNPVHASYSLVPLFLKCKISSKYTDMPLEWATELVKNVNKYIQNKDIKHNMDMTVIMYATTYMNSNQLEKFWPFYKQQASKDIVDMYSAQVEAMINNKSGVMAHDNEFCDAAGNVHRFSEFKGKVLYVDIWATWCGPCKMEIPHLAKVVEHFKDNDDVKIISISVDTNRKAWENKIAADKPAWTQYIANKQQYAQISKDWGIMGIPRFILINKDGSIYDGDAIRPSNPKLIPLLEEMAGQTANHS
nr:TlpA disulfide reductase family protein [uncultured Prevotella sp.]